MAIRVPLGAHEADEGANGHVRGGRVAFDDLWQHRAALHEICQRIVGDAATADDVVQETYVRALRNLDRLEQRPSLMPWLATVARRRSIDELRRRQYQRPVEAMPDESTRPEHDPGEAASITETVAKVREALTSLTHRERELLVRQVNQGLSLAELADLDQSSVASVRSVLSRARTKLRDALTNAGTRVVAPFGLLGGWMKRKVGAVNARVQRVSPVLPGGYERVGEVATAAVAAAALAISGALPSVFGDGGPSSRSLVANLDGAGVLSSARDGGSLHDRLAAGAPERSARTSHPGGATGAAPTGGAGPAENGSGPTLPGGSPVPSPGELPAAPRPSDPPTHPTPQPEDPPDDPDDAIIEDITFPGEGFTTTGSNQTPVFVLGSYHGECVNDLCDVLFRSDDGGATWTKLAATGLDADSIIVSPAWPQDKRIFAQGPSGLLVSYNGGKSFSPALEGVYRGPTAMSPGFGQGDDSILIGSAPYWRYHGEPVAEPNAVTGLSGDRAYFAYRPDYTTSGVLFAGSTQTSAGGVLKPSVWTCTGGTCSAPQHLPQLFDAPLVHVASTYGTDGIVAAWRDDRLYLSTGADLHFELITNLPTAGAILGVADDGRGALYVALSGIGHEAPAGIARTTDGGRTWTLLGGGSPIATGIGTVAAVPDGPLLAAGSNSSGRGLYCSTDGGTTWHRRCNR